MIFHLVWTVMLLTLFTGIALWAFSSDNKKYFDDAAATALEPDDSEQITQPDIDLRR